MVSSNLRLGTRPSQPLTHSHPSLAPLHFDRSPRWLSFVGAQLCQKVAAAGKFSLPQCQAYLQTQRQVTPDTPPLALARTATGLA